MNSRHALERQWAALIVRQPAARHILLKYLRAFNIEGYWVRVDDPQAALILRAVQLLIYRHERVTPSSVAEHLAAYDFTMSPSEALQFVERLVANLPPDVDAERLALAVLAAWEIAMPEPVLIEYAADPYGRRADLMQSRKVRVQK